MTIKRKHQQHKELNGHQEYRRYKPGEVEELDLRLRSLPTMVRLEAPRTVRSVAFNCKLSEDIYRLCLSTEGIVDWVHTQIYLRHSGEFQCPSGRYMDKNELDVTAQFSEDAGRYISTYLDRRWGNNTQRLQRRIIGRIQFMKLAHDIWTDRLKAR